MPHEFIDLQYDERLDLRTAILAVCDQAEAAVRAGKLVLLLSDRYLVKGKLPIQALLATGAVHHRLVRTGLRCKCNILVETGTARDAHHFACLIGYGATAVYPYLAYQTLFDLMRKGAREDGGRHGARSSAAATGAASARACSRSCPRWASRPSRATAARSCSRSSGLRDEVVALCFEGSDSRIQGADFARPEARSGISRERAPGIRRRASSRAGCSSTCTAANTTCTTRT